MCKFTLALEQSRRFKKGNVGDVLLHSSICTRRQWYEIYRYHPAFLSNGLATSRWHATTYNNDASGIQHICIAFPCVKLNTKGTLWSFDYYETIGCHCKHFILGCLQFVYGIFHIFLVLEVIRRCTYCTSMYSVPSQPIHFHIFASPELKTLTGENRRNCYWLQRLRSAVLRLVTHL